MRKSKRPQPRRPFVDLSRCSKCGGCIEVAPEIFSFSVDGSYIEICDLDYYDRDKVGIICYILSFVFSNSFVKDIDSV